MKRTKWIFLYFLLLITVMVSAKKHPQKLLVEDVQGKVEIITKHGKSILQRGEVLTLEDILNVPFNGMVTLLSEREQKQYIIKSPGRATLKALLQDKRNTVLERTKDYVTHVLRQIRKETRATPKRSSDPATVTRDSIVYKRACEDSL